MYGSIKNSKFWGCFGHRPRGNGAFAPSFAEGSPGDDVVVDFGNGPDRIDLRAFETSFRALDDNRDGRLATGEGDGFITVQIIGNDTQLSFTGGSVRIEDATNLRANDFLF
jgi:hypothetical protein